MAETKALVVVSHYCARPREPLDRLLAQLVHVPGQTTVVVFNDDRCNSESWGTLGALELLTRPNRGMNIGAWDAAFRERGDRYSHMIFLQDECEVVRADFVQAYCEKLDEPHVGMIGESINSKWDQNWSVLSRSSLNYPVGQDSQGRTIDRVFHYRQCMHAWGIEPGPTGRHLRALVWGLRTEVLRSIHGFPIGSDKESCIAAEIAVSRHVEHKGWLVLQSDTQPFRFLQHCEWRADGSGKKARQ